MKARTTSLEGSPIEVEQTSLTIVSRRQMLHLMYAPLAIPAVALASRKKRKHSKKSKKAKKSRREVRDIAPAVTGPMSGANLYNDIIAYYNLGEHRTATAGDEKTSNWIAALLRRAGLRTDFETFTLDQFFLHKADLTVAGSPVASFPLWPPLPTGSDPLKGKLALFPGRGQIRGRIAVVRFPFDPYSSIQPESEKGRLVAAAARAGATAIIAISEGSTGEIIALNSRPGPPLWPVPVLLVPSRNETELVASAQRGDDAIFLLDGNYDSAATARNVIGRLDRGKKLIVVSTPQSGWFRCAGERGPGIAFFVALARWAAARDSDTSFLFVSTSGHELGEIGMKQFIDERAPAPRHVTAWIHLGAGMATYQWEPAPPGVPGMRRVNQVDPNRFLMCSPNFIPLLEPIYAGLPGLQPRKAVALGEFAILIKNGYRTIGFAAGHRFHHTPADSPEVTSPALLEPLGQALINTIEAIEEMAKD